MSRQLCEVTGGTNAAWAELDDTFREVETKAKESGKRFEIWTTISGRIDVKASVRD